MLNTITNKNQMKRIVAEMNDNLIYRMIVPVRVGWVALSL